MKIAIIPRAPEHSPNMVSNDTAILECIADELRKMGADTITIDSMSGITEEIDIICHMSRSQEVLNCLKEAESNGITVVNTPQSVENCSRLKVMTILEESNIPQPEFRVINDIKDLEGLDYPAWLKRGEGWSCHKDDIFYAKNCAEARDAFKRMLERGIKKVICTRHCNGDIIKFYGVEDKYFTFHYPIIDNTKFGLEKINGTQKHYPFDAEKMRDIVYMAAKSIGLKIYGGDCIVDSEGRIYLIDLNDFPSFSSVREEAAREIALSIMNSRN